MKDSPSDRSPACDPLDVPQLSGQVRWASYTSLLVWGFVVLGITIRLSRYLLCFPLWGDEYMLAENILLRDYRELLQPLDHHQMAPVLFLWLVRAMVELFGFSEWSLRLVPAVCGIASVLVYRHLAVRLFSGTPLVLAMAVFAVAHFPIRHTTELKPYASDLLVALVLLSLAVEWWRAPGRSGWLWFLAVVTPVALALSFPAVFVAGGISLGLVVSAWRSNRWATWTALGLFHVAMVGTFLLVVWNTSSPQFDTVKGAMRNIHWASSFPPLTGAGPLLMWMLETHTGEMFAYPAGGQNGASAFTFACFVTAALVMWRSPYRTVLIMFLGMFALGLLAAFLHQYPYGGNERLVQYLAPAICLMAGLGTARLVATLGHLWLRRGVATGYVVVLALVGMGILARDVSFPYAFPESYVHQGFARWFWQNEADQPELVCATTDLGINFYTDLGIEAYLTYQAIYSKRHGPGQRRQFVDPATHVRPFRCVVFRYAHAPPDELALREMRARMDAHYKLVDRETHRLLLGQKRRGEKWIGVYDVYHFQPKADGPLAETTPPDASLR